jgi:hypothetical protein
VIVVVAITMVLWDYREYMTPCGLVGVVAAHISGLVVVEADTNMQGKLQKSVERFKQ